jgi:hypothetical protein
MEFNKLVSDDLHGFKDLGEVIKVAALVDFLA